MDGRANPGIGRQELGRRVREVRQQRRMTLKDTELRAGLSATHISEVERGKTSPTIGALIRIAGALSCDVSYFVELEALPEVSITRAGDRSSREMGPARIQVQTSGIPGGRLQAVSIQLDGDRKPLVIHPGAGSFTGFVRLGSIRFETGADVQLLESGDSFHVHLDKPVQLTSAGGPAEIFVVTTAPFPPVDMRVPPHGRID